MNTCIKNELPTAEEYVLIRNLAGWGHISKTTAIKSLSSTVISVCVRHDETLVGFGRVVGDGVLYFYVSDIFVHPSQRGRRLGEAIMGEIVEQVRATAQPGATIAVLAAPGRETFYERAGFKRCPNDVFGQAMAFLEPIRLAQGE